MQLETFCNEILPLTLILLGVFFLVLILYKTLDFAVSDEKEKHFVKFSHSSDNFLRCSVPFM